MDSINNHEAGYSGWRRCLNLGATTSVDNSARRVLIAFFDPTDDDGGENMEVERYWWRGELCAGVGAICVRYPGGYEIEARCKYDDQGNVSWWEVRYPGGVDLINEDDSGWFEPEDDEEDDE